MGSKISYFEFYSRNLRKNSQFESLTLGSNISSSQVSFAVLISLHIACLKSNPH